MEKELLSIDKDMLYFPMIHVSRRCLLLTDFFCCCCCSFSDMFFHHIDSLVWTYKGTFNKVNMNVKQFTLSHHLAPNGNFHVLDLHISICHLGRVCYTFYEKISDYIVKFDN